MTIPTLDPNGTNAELLLWLGKQVEAHTAMIAECQQCINDHAARFNTEKAEPEKPASNGRKVPATRKPRTRR